MEWSDEELSDVMSRGSSAAPTGIRVPALPASTLKAMMTRAVKLVAARGGTMTAERLATALNAARCGSGPEVNRLRDYIAAQGARIAVLEAESAGYDEGLSKGWDDGAEAMRAACLEAVQRVATIAGAHGLLPVFKAAIEGATP